MPRTDPITGCQVMTNAEFWQSEADLEGKGRTAGEVMSDFMEDVANENEREAERNRDPELALNHLREAADEDLAAWLEWRETDTSNEPAPPIPERVIEVIESEYNSGFKTTTMKLSAIVMCDDGQKRKATLNYSSYSGDFYEPPSDDWELTWEEIVV